MSGTGRASPQGIAQLQSEDPFRRRPAPKMEPQGLGEKHESQRGQCDQPVGKGAGAQQIHSESQPQNGADKQFIDGRIPPRAASSRIQGWLTAWLSRWISSSMVGK